MKVKGSAATFSRLSRNASTGQARPDHRIPSRGSWAQVAAATRAALSEAGIEVRGERDVLVVDVEDRPGTMGVSRAGSGRPA
jgi:hypothetical protein